MVAEKEIVLYVASWPKTLAQSAVTLLTFACLFAPGIWFDSPAMQWAAAILWIMWILGFAHSLAKGNRVTLSGARKRLDELEAGQ